MVRKSFLLLLTIAFFFTACKKEYVPKPRGYYRISFPEKVYQPIDHDFPYQFNIPKYSKLIPDTQAGPELYWGNIEIQNNNAEIHISYKQVENNLNILTEESRSLAYKHSIKADAIDEQVYVNPEKNVYGTIYLIDGNAASPIQFFLTDSSKHFLRGALYIREIPNIDSIRPVIDFLRPDIVHLIESASWKN